MKIDAHVHCNSTRNDLLEYGIENDIRFLSIITDVPEFPSIEDQLKTVVGLKKNYGNHLNFAISYSCRGWESKKWLDSFPLTMIDLAERIVHIQHQAGTNWQKVHDFFIQYQNRIIYGADVITNDANRNNGLEAYLDKRYQMDWDFFANDHSIAVPEVKGSFRGLCLLPPVLQKIYHTNAKRNYKI